MLRSKFLCKILPVSAFLDLLELRRKRWQYCSSRLFWPNNLPSHLHVVVFSNFLCKKLHFAEIYLTYLNIYVSRESFTYLPTSTRYSVSLRAPR